MALIELNLPAGWLAKELVLSSTLERCHRLLFEAYMNSDIAALNEIENFAREHLQRADSGETTK